MLKQCYITLHLPSTDELLEGITSVACETAQFSLAEPLYVPCESTLSVTETSSSTMLVGPGIMGSTTYSLTVVAAGIVGATSSTMLVVEPAGIRILAP